MTTERTVAPLRSGQFVGFENGVKWIRVWKVGEGEIWFTDQALYEAIHHPEDPQWSILQRPCQTWYTHSADSDIYNVPDLG